MAGIIGSNAVVAFGGLGGGIELDAANHGLSNASYQELRDYVPRIQRGGTQVDVPIGTRSGQLSFECDDTSAVHHAFEFVGAASSRQGLIVYPEGKGSGKPAYAGSGLVSLSWSARAGQVRRYSVTVLVDGVLVKSTQ